MNINSIISGKQYKVLVRCNTFNQSQFIETALNGFAMQITDFPFVCIVMDDCSTDGEIDVLKKYIQEECKQESAECCEDENVFVELLPHKSNANCTFAFYFLKRNLYKQKEIKALYVKPWQDICTYEAFCEGDDYWIDPKKLQKQTTYLEKNLDFFLVGSNGVIRYTEPTSGLRFFNSCQTTREVPFQELVEKWFFPTASLMYRTKLWEVYPKWSKELHFADDVIVMTSAIHGRVACLGELTCVYRKGVGITKKLDKQYIYMCEQHLLFYNHLLEDTGRKYEECLKRKIHLLEKDLKYYQTKEKSSLLVVLLYPRKSVKSVLVKMYLSIRKICRK